MEEKDNDILNDINNTDDNDKDKLFLNSVKVKKIKDLNFYDVENATSTLQKKIEKVSKDYEYKLEKYEKQFEVVSNLKINIDSKNEAKTGYENVLKRIYNKNENNDNENNITENKTNSTNAEDKKNNEGIFGSIMSFFTIDNSENAKIKKKIKDINKNIDEKNKLLDSNQKLLDKYKKDLEICKNEQNLLQQQLDTIQNKSEKTKRDLLKSLSERLKLSAKFVATSKY